MRVVDTSAWIEWLLGTALGKRLELPPNDEAVDYPERHSLAMADAIIYATAMKHGADLLTCDAHFASLPDVVYFARSPSP
jgi:predicted nucleic acid-binding protein